MFNCAFFVVYTSAPYLRQHSSLRLTLSGAPTTVGSGRGYQSYVDDALDAHPINHTDPFTFGVCWESK